MWLDKFTIKNLELLNSQHENGTSLIDIIDETVTPMGGRMLKKWVVWPLKTLEDIKYRQDFVTIFVNNDECEKNFDKRKKENLILEGKDALCTLKEMQNEVAKNLMEYEYLKNIFFEYIDEATLNFSLYSLFVKIYICKDKLL